MKNVKQNEKNMLEKKPFFQRRWVMWAFLIVFAPVGILLLWKYSTFEKVPKIAISAVFGMLFLIAGISSFVDQDKNGPLNPSSVVIDKPVVTQDENDKPDIQVEPEPIAEPTPSATAQAADAILADYLTLSVPMLDQLLLSLQSDNMLQAYTDIRELRTIAQEAVSRIYEKMNAVDMTGYEEDTIEEYKSDVISIYSSYSVACKDILDYYDSGEMSKLADAQDTLEYIALVQTSAFEKQVKYQEEMGIVY